MPSEPVRKQVAVITVTQQQLDDAAELRKIIDAAIMAAIRRSTC